MAAAMPAIGGRAARVPRCRHSPVLLVWMLCWPLVPQVQWSPDEKTMLFFNGDDNARGTEEFRTLRSRLYHAREKMPLKKLLVTSALAQRRQIFHRRESGPGLVRQHGRRVLLIDADLRGPRLHMMLGTTSSPGLADYLQGSSDEFSIMQRGPMENLFFYSQRPGNFRSCGTGVQRAAEDCFCSGWKPCLTGSLSIRRRRCRFPMPACWRRLATAC